MSKEDLLEHLASEHGVIAPSSKSETRHAKAKKTASVLRADPAENLVKKTKSSKSSNRKGASSLSETNQAQDQELSPEKHSTNQVRESE